MATLPLISDEDASPAVRAVFDDIRASRNTDYVNNFWRALAHNPDELADVWARIKTVMAPGAIDPLTKELIYIAVSTANNCGYCLHSHTASARAKGMTPQIYSELLAVIAMASRTNALATAMQLDSDPRFTA